LPPMTIAIDIIATTLGAARPATVLGHASTKTIFQAYLCSRFGFPLSVAEFEKNDGNNNIAFYAATIGKFPGRNPTSMVFGIVAGQEEVLVYDIFGLVALITPKKTKVIRKKMRVAASFDAIRDASLLMAATPLAPVSGRVAACPACGEQAVKLKTFLDNWKQSGRLYVQMPLCRNCASMTSGREWMGSVLCRNCGSRVKEGKDKCQLCGEYPLPAH